MSIDTGTELGITCIADGFDFEAPVGRTLMQVLKDTGFDIEASCEGCLACGTCHVVLEPQWYPRAGTPGPQEQAMLRGLLHTQPTSRLSCQIQLTPALDGLSLSIPR